MNNKILVNCIFFLFIFLSLKVTAQDKFEQLDSILPTPNKFRTATGDVGPDYFQQQVNYDIDVKLDEKKRLITGKEKITYYNNSPHTLDYLWVQLDQNVRKKNGVSSLSKTSNAITDKTIYSFDVKNTIAKDFKDEMGYKIKSVTDGKKTSLKYIINNTMMRIDLKEPLKSQGNFVFNIEWEYYVYDRYAHNGRGGYEYFPDTDDYIFALAQWYPRMAVYDDVNGWQNKQFLGQGEFALEFGDFNVKIIVPKDHIVASTGSLKNPKDVLSAKQYDRYVLAKKSFIKPLIIVSEKEVKKKERSEDSDKWSTWKFEAKNVRDFAFASSKKFIWDGMAVKIGNNTPMAYSYYPKEGNPLWEKESTKAVKNALEYYSEKTIGYPYPQASSVHTANIGMEYPMICFNFGRPNKRGKYSDRIRNDMISVIIHEVGHNFFPMIVNSDERQWTWLDEGLNTFLETETMKYKYPKEKYNFELSWSYLDGLTNSGYLTLPLNESRPIMTNSENILEFGYNAYVKPAAVLKLLRYTILGTDLFDYSFKTYSQRWAFKRPTPADFFRTMEDASGTDLDWFWRGWFYTVDYVDVDVSDVQYFRFKKDSEIDNSMSVLPQNDKLIQQPKLIELVSTDERFYTEYRSRVDDDIVKASIMKNHIYEVEFKNLGELVTPLLLEWHYKDGTTEKEYIPAEIWRKNDKRIKKVFYKTKQVQRLVFDPDYQLGDVNIKNNAFPREIVNSEYDDYNKGK